VERGKLEYKGSGTGTYTDLKNNGLGGHIVPRNMLAKVVGHALEAERYCTGRRTVYVV
jgi:hypothetical protein